MSDNPPPYPGTGNQQAYYPQYPAQPGYPQPQGGYPPNQGGYPPPQQGYPQPQQGYPQNAPPAGWGYESQPQQVTRTVVIQQQPVTPSQRDLERQREAEKDAACCACCLELCKCLCCLACCAACFAD